MKTPNVVIAGLGGQGVLKASDILADAAINSGYDVKKAEVHGMSQRGGSVSSDVRFGEKVLSPMVPEAEADFLLVLDATQVDVNRQVLREGGVLIAPDAVDENSLPSKRVFNIAMLGALAAKLQLPAEAWQAAIRAALPEKVWQMNEDAFAMGQKAGAAVSKG